MAKSVISKRLAFPKGKQQKFLLAVQAELGMKNSHMAKVLGISVRTLTDWKREKFLLPLGVGRLLNKKSGVAIPRKVRVKEKYWYVTKGACNGALAVIKKYGAVGGNPEYRKKRWREWWERTGRFKKNLIFRAKSFRRPDKSVELAEFIGIMMGDGGMSARQIFITLHHIDDKAYAKFVVRMIHRLFGLKPSLRYIPKSSVNSIVVSRTNLVKYLHSLGLPIGNKIKQGLDIPDWIKRNQKFSLACIRGLVDTDGSIFTHSYKVNGKKYQYKKLCFTTASEPLLHSVYETLRGRGFVVRLVKRGKREVRIDGVEYMKRYLELVGSHNPKHLKRYGE